jgi:hypothetical protein
MPKVSRANAPMHFELPDGIESFSGEAGGWDISFDRYLTDIDGTTLFKGAPGDVCQASHVGYIIKGRMVVRHADGNEEVFEAGDAFVLTPGHLPLYSEGLEMVSFTPAEEAQQQMSYMLPNVKAYLAERGMELPREFQPQA